MRERAFAKLNLSMDITGRLDGGYHAVRSVMQSVEFGDELVPVSYTHLSIAGCADIYSTGLAGQKIGNFTI